MRYVDPEITVADIGERVAVVSIHGELDLNCAGELREALNGSEGQGRSLVVDLVGATFVDSTALGILNAASKGLQRAGGSLTIVASDPRILRIFKLTGLDRTIAVERSLAEAIAQRLVSGAAV